VIGRTLRARLGAGFAAAVVAVLAVACGGPGSSTADPGALRVVATTTVLADLVANVGGSRISVTSLVPKGGEVHTFDPSPGDVADLSDADLVVMNGLGLDDWLVDLVEGSGSTAEVLRLGEDLPGVEYIDEGGAVNPHLWLDISFARRYVDRIAETLADVDPDGADDHRAAAAAYAAELDALDAAIRERMDAIPAENRRIVSFHEAFPYFARAYGLEVVGVVVDAPGQDPSAGEIAALVEAIRSSGARAVFGEAQFSDKLARAIAEEAGVPVETRLYNDSLGDAPADDYVGMMEWNAERIEAALR
jgi:zinc/manganese transport system substrate-binding protein/manganese/iron transport system substrate-binding protein